MPPRPPFRPRPGEVLSRTLAEVGWGEPEDVATFSYILIAMVKQFADENLNGGDLPPLRDFPWPEVLQSRP